MATEHPPRRTCSTPASQERIGGMGFRTLLEPSSGGAAFGAATNRQEPI